MVSADGFVPSTAQRSGPGGVEEEVGDRIRQCGCRVGHDNPRPTRSSMPSQPTDVATTGRPTSSASMIFSRVPPPARKGATTTLARARNGLTSATVPVTSIRSSARARTAGAGSLPIRSSRASGTRAKTFGQISCPSQTAASTLGAHPRVATKATVGSGASGSTVDGSRPFGQTRTERAPAGIRALSCSLTTRT